MCVPWRGWGILDKNEWLGQGTAYVLGEVLIRNFSKYYRPSAWGLEFVHGWGP